MNREERRKLTRHFKAEGYSEETIKEVIKLKENMSSYKHFEEGQKVKLNIEKLKSDPDWDKNLDANKTRHHNWVEVHKDDIFTIEYDKNHQDGILVCFKEDTTEPKWLFYEGDLVEVKE